MGKVQIGMEKDKSSFPVKSIQEHHCTIVNLYIVLETKGLRNLTGAEDLPGHVPVSEREKAGGVEPMGAGEHRVVSPVIRKPLMWLKRKSTIFFRQ